MKNLSFFILAILLGLSACAPQPPTLFDTFLPEKDRQVLNKWLSLYDGILEKKYSNASSPQKALLHDLLANSVQKNLIAWQLEATEICQLLNLYDASTLEYKDTIMTFDTVYASDQDYAFGEFVPSEDSVIIAITQENDTSVTWDILLPAGSSNNMAAKVNCIDSKGYRKFLSESSFRVACEQANIENDSLILGYLEERQRIGLVEYNVLAGGALMQSDEQLEHPIIKRLIVFEAFIGYFKKHLQCP